MIGSILCATLSLVLWGQALGAEPLWRAGSVNGRVEEAVFSRDGARVALRTADGRVLIRDRDGSTDARVFSSRPFAPARVAMSADGSRVVWSDYSGRVSRWSAADGAIERQLQDCAVFGLGVGEGDGSIIAAGDGAHLYWLTGSGLTTQTSRDLYLEQARTLAMDAAGDLIVVGDHSGRLVRFARFGSGYSIRSTRVAETGIQAIWLAGGTDGAIAVLDDSGLLRVLDGDKMDARGEAAFAPATLLCARADPANARLLLGMADGSVRALATDTLDISPPLAELGEAVVGLGIDPAGAILAATASGRIGAVDALAADAPAPGAVTRVAARLRAGDALLQTTTGNRRLALADGTGMPDPEADEAIRVDAAWLGGAAPRRLELLLSGDAMQLVVADAGATGPQPLSLDGSPSRVAAGVWTPLAALMGADGRIEVYRLGNGEWELLYSLDADPAQVWSELRFVERDAYLLAHGTRGALVLDLASGVATAFAGGAGHILSTAAWSAADQALWFGDGDELLRIPVGGNPQPVVATPDGAPVLAIRPAHDGHLDVWTATAQLRIEDGAIAAAYAAPDSPLRTVHPLADGPFVLGVAESGGMALERRAGAPLLAAFPALVPLAGGGMDTGPFGRIRAALGGWMDHAAYGWGFAQAGQGTDWYWFGGAGWLAGGERLHPYLYSARSESWLLGLAQDFDSGWIFDYRQHAWRPLRQ
jgi:hypothetical protein